MNGRGRFAPWFAARHFLPLSLSVGTGLSARQKLMEQFNDNPQPYCGAIPGMSQKIVYDNAGRPYQLTLLENEGDFLCMNLCDKRTWIGQCRGYLRSPDELFIGDLVIFEEAIRPDGLGLWLLRKFKPHACKPPSYRGRGLGTALLESVIAYARQKGFRCITGDIVERDAVATLYLMHFYEVHGFQIAPPRKEGPNNAVASIVLDITEAG